MSYLMDFDPSYSPVSEKFCKAEDLFLFQDQYSIQNVHFAEIVRKNCFKTFAAIVVEDLLNGP